MSSKRKLEHASKNEIDSTLDTSEKNSKDVDITTMYGNKNNDNNHDDNNDANHKSEDFNNDNKDNKTELNKYSFKCEYPGCCKVFTKRWSIHRHQMIHSGEKPYECKLCDKKFIQKCSLTRHELIHTNIMPWICDVLYCGKKFKLKQYLDLHKKHHHDYIYNNKDDISNDDNDNKDKNDNTDDNDIYKDGNDNNDDNEIYKDNNDNKNDKSDDSNDHENNSDDLILNYADVKCKNVVKNLNDDHDNNNNNDYNNIKFFAPDSLNSNIDEVDNDI